MKGKYTIIAPQMAPIQFQFLEQVFHDAGFKLKIVKAVSPAAVELGQRVVNNDMCYPAILSVGQVVDAAINLKDENGNPDPNVAIVMTQTGGGCRASQYVSVIRKALRDLGREDIPVIPLAFTPPSKDEDEPWNVLGLKIRDVKRALYAILLGDLIMVLQNKVRPYEAVPGATNEEVDKMVDHVRSQLFINMDKSMFRSTAKLIINQFAKIKLSTSLDTKPKIGIVGEILLKYHPDGNNNLAKIIEREGCEAVVSPLIDFFLYCLSGPVFQHELLETSRRNAELAKAAIRFVEKHKNIINDLFYESGKFQTCHWPSIYNLSEKATGIISRASSMGEGWLLPAEIVDLVEEGCPHVVIAQPFACLPNHCIGQGTIVTITKKFPQADILSINYDPGASRTNQENRVKLLATNAKRAHKKDF